MPNRTGWPPISIAASRPTPPRNRLLATLAPAQLDGLRPHLTPVELAGDQTLFGAGDPIGHVYFVEQGVLSLMADTGADDVGIEIGMIGSEGLAGLNCLTSGNPVSFHHTKVRLPGSALRMPAACFRRHLREVPALHEACLRYLDAFVIQVAQTGACHGRHRLAERCASWLLVACDRAGRQEFPLTHDALSAALGVRRAGVTVTIGALQNAGLIRCSKGRTAVLDRAGLERAACGCYRLVRDGYDRLLECA